MIKVTFDDGTVIDYPDDAVIEIENYPRRETPKEGWERTREYPPEYRRFSPLRINVLTIGHTVRIHSGISKVTAMEHVSEN